MRKIFRLLILLFIFGLIWNWVSRPVYAKSYSITADKFIINLQPDKSAFVIEELTYDFSGSFTWADMYIPTQINRQGNIYSTKITNFSVSSTDGTNVSILETYDSDKFYVKWG